MKRSRTITTARHSNYSLIPVNYQKLLAQQFSQRRQFNSSFAYEFTMPSLTNGASQYLVLLTWSH